MTDQHVKGAVSSARGTVMERVAALTGDQKLATMDAVHHAQGTAQGGPGDVGVAVREAGRA